jgi:hypothetical protein
MEGTTTQITDSGLLRYTEATVPSGFDGPVAVAQLCVVKCGDEGGAAHVFPGTRFSLYDGENLFGRSNSASVSVKSVASVSGKHAIIECNTEDGTFTVKDLGSTNGTFLSRPGEGASCSICFA